MCTARKSPVGIERSDARARPQKHPTFAASAFAVETPCEVGSSRRIDGRSSAR